MKNSGRALQRFGPHKMGAKTQAGEFDKGGMRSTKKRSGRKHGRRR